MVMKTELPSMPSVSKTRSACPTTAARDRFGRIARVGIAAVLLQYAFNGSSASCPTIPQWIPIGPGPLFIGSPDSTVGQGPDAGMVRAIAIDPSGTTDQVIYIATDSGGVWKSVDGGTNWLPKTDLMAWANIGAIALDPGDPSVVYAGTGNAANQFLGLDAPGGGIYKSTNGGENWVVLGAAIFTNGVINRLVLPDHDLLLVASSFGLFDSADGGLHFGNNPPLFDNGNPVLGGYVTDLAVDTASATTVYAAVYGAGIFKSTNSGATFPVSGQLLGVLPGTSSLPGYIAFAQSTKPNNQTLYVNAQAGSSGSAVVLSSNDGGTSWNQIPVSDPKGPPDLLTPQTRYAQTVGVDPQDANRAYFGAKGLYLVTDGGASGITPANRIGLNALHADQHALVFSPPSHWTGPAPTRVYDGTDGGLATTANAGPTATWTILNGIPACLFGNGALATVLFRQIDIGRGSPANNAYTYGVAQDLGFSAHQPNCLGTPWLFSGGGDGNSVAVDPLNPQHALAALNGGLAQTIDGGLTAPVNGAGVPGAPGLVYFDPNGGRAYATAGANGVQLYQSTDNGASFTLIRTFPASILSMSIAPVDSNSIWVGLGDGTVQNTANAQAGAGATWTAHAIPNKPAAGVSGVAVDPGNAAQAVVVYRATTQNVFRTVDSGNTWTMISSNLSAAPLNAVAIDPNTIPHAILVATDTGVMRTGDLGRNWETLGLGLPSVHCTSLALDSSAVPSLVRVGTYGRSAFELAFDRVYVSWQNTGPQDGTLQHPFQTVLQGLNVPNTGAVRYLIIQAGDYVEGPNTFSQCATLNAINGAVTIH